REDLRTSRPRLVVRHVDDADAGKGLGHVTLPNGGLSGANSLLAGNLAKFPLAARLKGAQTLNKCAIPPARAGNFLRGRRELFSLSREFNPVIGIFSDLVRLLWLSQEI